jgi:superfamily II DNA or RNA helicase
MRLKLPPAEKLIGESGGNYILQRFGNEVEMDCELENVSPFILRSGDTRILITTDEGTASNPDFPYVLLATRQPKRNHFRENQLKIKRWLFHPKFRNCTPSDVLDSWRDNFEIIKEDPAHSIQGLRSPQIGALYSILAHVQNPEDRAIVVMPTGTGKTEVMLTALVANRFAKLLVAVPSDTLRTQISEKFISLGLLRPLGLLGGEARNPIVGVVNSGFRSGVDLSAFINNANVVVTTMSILTGCDSEQKTLIQSTFSHLFVDEAHHSEAPTWSHFIDGFPKDAVYLFTATPFRTDDKKLKGKFIFNFSLKNAQAQGYYKTINFIPIRLYNQQSADQEIARKAVERLRADRAAGFNHLIMARCANKKRAKEVFEYYRIHTDLDPIMVYTGVPGLAKKIEEVKEKRHAIIICVDMLGEGFDLPELKIAAIHDPRQSLPITLQFIGRFTRTSYTALGQASFVANIADPPIKADLDHLFAKDADWNLLLPNLSGEATAREINFRHFLEGFQHLDESVIPFQQIRPALSTEVYRHNSITWRPNNWREGIPRLDTFEHQFSSYNPHESTLVIILGKISLVDWGDFDTVQNVEWDMVVVVWDLRPNVNRVYVNYSFDKFNAKKLLGAVMEGEVEIVNGMDVFKIFHEVRRLSVFNFGGRRGRAGDISFQSYFGRGVQDGLNLLEQGQLVKNNIFGLGYRDGDKITLGCSTRGKIWSYARGNLDELRAWCSEIGDIITDPAINSNTVLEHTLFPSTVSERPALMPISVEWHHEMLGHPEFRYVFFIEGVQVNLFDIELNIVEVPITDNIRFSLDANGYSIVFELELGSRPVGEDVMSSWQITKVTTTPVQVSIGGNAAFDAIEFFTEFTPTIWFADSSYLYQNQHVKLRERLGGIPLDNIIEDTWTGVALNRESQGVEPYERDSIQYYFIEKIRNDYEIIYDDDGKGEISDVVAINDFDHYMDIHLFHLKYARGGTIGNNIENFYQVCGQAQKSLSWKVRSGRDFFDHLFARMEKTDGGRTCSRLIKGNQEDLERLQGAAKYTKEMRFHIYIGQPGFRKAGVSPEILLLLGSTYHYLHTIGNVDLKVYSS